MNRPFLAAATALLTGAGLLSGCSLATSAGDGEVLDVWMMNHSAGEEFLDKVVTGFERENEGVEVRVTIQEWGGIGEKITEALDSGEGPDVIEVGNTQVAQYVDIGGVKDLTNQVIDLKGDDWIAGLAQPGQVYGHQYGIPFYAANRVVIHRTDLFEEAGIDELPRDRAEWLDVTEKLNQGAQQGIYLPGQNWYVLAGFIWDEGGELAVESGGQWRGTLDTAEAEAGMAFYERLHSLGNGPSDTDEANPDHAEVFARGDVAQLISTPNTAQTIVELNPSLAGKLGFFPVPGKDADTPGAVFTGGSNLIIPQESDSPVLAYEFVKTLTSEEWQTELAQSLSLVPNRTTLAEVVKDDPGAAAMVEGATRNGRSAPHSPRWGDVEVDNPIKEYQSAVLNGADPQQAGKDASEELTALLNGLPRNR
ncbi:extracellular solute-binding protein [Streptomyces sp. ACA25]|uniref:extracellular solute-binding protein n=1 Tax=Streptomyces sp. ACA25 TaxID=3022596 RepID=UPI0023072D28|nr:extracellular solute-binding protein [Streptomyces sp. ACA25]MDB1090129.1 extracellular solute-binding protein [Streptomyces sp. ACA25]